MTSPESKQASVASLAQRLEEQLKGRLELEKKLKRLKWGMFGVSLGFAAILAFHVFLLEGTQADAHFLVWIVLLTGGLLGAIEIIQKLAASSREELEILRRIAADKEST